MGESIQIVGQGLVSNQVHQPILAPDQLALLTISPEREPFDGDPQRCGWASRRCGWASRRCGWASRRCGWASRRCGWGWPMSTIRGRFSGLPTRGEEIGKALVAVEGAQGIPQLDD